MAEKPGKPLDAFNGKVNLALAYKWEKDQVERFLLDATEHPDEYGVPSDNQDDLRSIRMNLLSLAYPEGPNFRIVEPYQHIYREVNPEWIIPPRRPGEKPPKRPDEGKSPKCNLRKFPPVNGRAYFGFYDLLGAFLSLMGPAPDGANAENFYIPLTSMYGRWFRHFHDLVKRTHDWQNVKVPAMLQCTWKRTVGVKRHDYFLGCSLAGEAACVNRSRTKEPWLLGLQRERFNLVSGAQMKAEEFSFDKPRVPSSNGRVPQKFGNCAETYPFLTLLRNHDVTKEKCYGFAMNFSEVHEDNTEPPLIRWRKLVNPCLNCERLIDWYGGNLANFMDGIPIGIEPF